jgi:hypothetical protein
MRGRLLFLGLVAAAALGVVFVPSVLSRDGAPAARAGCPAGYKPGSAEQVKEALSGLNHASMGQAEALLAGSCVSVKHPEKTIEMILRQEGLESVRSAPYDHVAPGAYANALAETATKPKKGKVKGTQGQWAPYGQGPLIVNGTAYGQVNGLGLVYNQGRIDSLEYDAANGRLFAAFGTGGVWMSTDLGNTWRSIGDTLPSQVVGAVAWSPANRGTVLAVSGDPTFGAGGYTGYGAFYSTNLGASWSKATGVPDGALGFAIEVDPSDPKVVYAATSKGLYRSADGGKTYVNTNLPTDCTDLSNGICQLANVVTDVEVKAPGGVNSDVPAGTVIAAVGWRASDRTNTKPDGSPGAVQSPGQGLYRSATGAPGSFTKVAAPGTPGWPTAHRQGRVEFGAVTGAGQDHDYLYAIVQDAAALNGQLDVLDANVSDPSNSVRPGTVLNGIYVSKDFGQTWILMADDNVIAKDPATGSALVGYGQAVGYEPGVQGWYNLWIAPDPTRQSAAGVPTRLAFGLEEVWQNELNVPMDAPTTFKVIGRYFSDTTCVFLSLGLPECPTNRPPTTSTTTHPDQQDGIWIPDGSGGVTLAVGNDGGFYRQHVTSEAGSDPELDNGGWGDGNQTGFNTLLPYDVAPANDGTVWAGLQDNGHMKIKPDRTQYETYGGDGTFAEVDPNNSNVAYESYVFNAMSVTKDGGKTWTSIDPLASNTRFVNPFEMDPKGEVVGEDKHVENNHLVTAGNEVYETIYGPRTTGPTIQAGVRVCSATCWKKVYDLGTRSHPGDPNAAPPTLDPGSDPANQMSAIDVYGDAIYVGYCGVCDILNQKVGFKNGIATNVGGAEAPERMTSKGWHIAAATGLPNRFITSVAIDPRDTNTVYVTLGGYSRRWVPPGSLEDPTGDVGVGHLFKSTDAGETFTDISGNLPDVPATWVTVHGDQLVVGTDVGVFANATTGGTTFAYLDGLPVVPISTMNLKPDNPNVLFVATYGRGIWTFKFSPTDLPGAPEKPPTPAGVPLGGVPATGFGFELDAQGWTAKSENHLVPGGPTLDWGPRAPGHNSLGSFGVSPYGDETDASAVSPQLTHAGGWVFVDFQSKRDYESQCVCDAMIVEWSSDGVNWSPAPWTWDREKSSWSDELTYAGTRAKNPDFPNFTLEKVAFQAPAGPLYVRFNLKSDANVSSPPYTGAWIDDVVIHR